MKIRVTDLSDPRDNDSVTQLRIPAQHKNANSIKRAKQCETLVVYRCYRQHKKKEGGHIQTFRPRSFVVLFARQIK